jgi:hypothetical protein
VVHHGARDCACSGSGVDCSRWYTIVFTLLFAPAMIFLVRPQLRRLVNQATG